jgi:uncharacterized protein YunC (DUF1805 family)
MQQEEIILDTNSKAAGYVVELGKVNLVFAVAPGGMIGCGAFDVAALDKFKYAAAKIGSTDGSAIAGVDDLLNGVVTRANDAATACGVEPGMSGREALGKLCL